MKYEQKMNSSSIISKCILLLSLLLMSVLVLSSVVSAETFIKSETNYNAPSSLFDYTLRLPSEVTESSSIGAWTCDFDIAPTVVYAGENRECFCIDSKAGLASDANGGSESIGYGNLVECLRTGKNTLEISTQINDVSRNLDFKITQDYKPLDLSETVLAAVLFNEQTGAPVNSSSTIVCEVDDLAIGTADAIYTFYKKSPSFAVIARGYKSSYHLAEADIPLMPGDGIGCQVALYERGALVGHADSEVTLSITADTVLDITQAYISPAYPKFNDTLYCTGYANYASALDRQIFGVRHSFTFYVNNVIIGNEILWDDDDLQGQRHTESISNTEIERDNVARCDYKAYFYRRSSSNDVYGNHQETFTTDSVTVINSKPEKPEVSIWHVK